MNQEHEQGIKALEHCLAFLHGRTIPEMHFELAGITLEDLDAFKKGEKYMTEKQFYGFAHILRAPMLLTKPLINWLNLGDHWALVGILEPTFSLNGEPVRAILDFPYVIINNPGIKFHIGDSLIHTCINGLQEELFIADFEYSFFPEGYKPVYKLTVTRSNQDMQNTNNFNFGDNTQISGNTRFNAGKIIDNSINEFHELPTDFFPHVRELLSNIEENHRLELLEILSKIESANSKRDSVHWFGQFISRAADYITILQPAISIFGRYIFS